MNTKAPINLTYGSIISLIDNEGKHTNKLFFINNISEDSIELFENNGLATLNLKITDEGYFEDESIRNILVLHENKFGYASLNKLIPGKLIKIVFKNENTYEGKIVELEKDMITIEINDEDNTIIYIDFKYQGIDKDLNIKQIILIDTFEITKNNNQEQSNNNQDSENKEEYDDILIYSIEQQVDDYVDKNYNLNKKQIINNEIHKFKQLMTQYTNLDEGELYIKLSKNQLKNSIFTISNNIVYPLSSYVNIKQVSEEKEEDEENDDMPTDDNDSNFIINQDFILSKDVEHHKRILKNKDLPLFVVNKYNDNIIELKYEHINGNSSSYYLTKSINDNKKMVINGLIFNSIRNLKSKVNENITSNIIDKSLNDKNEYLDNQNIKILNTVEKRQNDKILLKNKLTYIPFLEDDALFKNYVSSINLNLDNIINNFTSKYEMNNYELFKKINTFGITELNFNYNKLINQIVNSSTKNLKQFYLDLSKKFIKNPKTQTTFENDAFVNDYMMFVLNNYLNRNDDKKSLLSSEIYDKSNIDARELLYLHFKNNTRGLSLDIQNDEIKSLIDNIKQNLLEQFENTNQMNNESKKVVKTYSTLLELEGDNQNKIILTDIPKVEGINNIKYLFNRLVAEHSYNEDITTFFSKLMNILENLDLNDENGESHNSLKEELFENQKNKDAIFNFLISEIIELKINKNQKCYLKQLDKYYIYDGYKWVEENKYKSRIQKKRIIRARNKDIEFNEIKMNILDDYLYTLLDEFENDKERQLYIDTQNFNEIFDNKRKNVIIHKNIISKNILKYNQYKNKLSLDFFNSGYLNNVKVSPYLSLLNYILAIDELSEKYRYLQNFIKLFTQDYNDNDWYYCVLTETKLVPKFLHKMADAYLINGNYDQVVRYICLKEGSISDNGDAWVHTKSGYNIKTIDFDVEYGYDQQGEKIVLDGPGFDDDDVVYDEDDVQLQDFISKDKDGDEIIKTQIVLNNIENKIFNLLTSISTYMNFSYKFEDKVKMLSKHVYNIYNISIKNKKYNDKKNKAILLAIFSFILTYIQCNDIYVEKSVLGCIQNFYGYPLLENEKENDGLKYISCVLHKLSNKNTSLPYSEFSNTRVDEIENELYLYIEKFTLQNAYINEIINKKRHSLMLEESQYFNRNDEYKKIIKQPELFKPSLYDLNVMNVNEYIVKKESKENLKDLSLLINKNIEQLLQKYISKEIPLLQSNEQPYIINYCCNSTDYIFNHILSDKSQKDELNNLINYGKKIENDIYNIKNKFSSFNNINIENKNIKIKPLNEQKLNEYNKKIVYLTIIKLCNFDNDNPIPQEFRKFITEKPGDFYVKDNKNITLDEKIKLLEENGFVYSYNIMINLLQIYHTQHILDDKKETKDEELNESYEQFIIKYGINEINIKESIDKMNSEINHIKKAIINKVLKKTKSRKIIDKINSVVNDFDSNENIEIKYQYNTFLYNLNYELINIIPSIVEYGNNMNGLLTMPHWELAEKHVSNLDTKYEKHRKYLNNLFEKLDEDTKNKIITISNEFKKILSYEDFKFNIAAQHIFMTWIYYKVLNVYFTTVNKDVFENIMLYIYDVYKPQVFNYRNIKSKTKQYKDSEKKIKTDRLKNMTQQQRDAQRALMKDKLGEWGYGQTQGVYKYISNKFIDEELSAIETQNMRTKLYEQDDEINEIFSEETDDPRQLLGDDDDNVNEQGDEFDGDEYY